MARYRYWPILGALLASMTWTMIGPETGWSRLVAVVLQGSTLLLALARSGRPASLDRLAVAVLAVTIGLSLLPLVVAGTAAAGPLSQAVLTAAAALAILSGLVRQLTITVHSIMGALCVYLLFGMFYASLAAAAAYLGGGRYFANVTAPDSADFLYFSFVTLTTVGYGDLTPVTSVGRLLAMIEALNGQLYLVSVVALLVGNVGRTRASGSTTRSGPVS